MLRRPVGIYIHIPFCDGKCPYCDFYSVAPSEDLCDRYCTALERQMEQYRGIEADTVYFGGGTPTLLGAERLCRLINSVKKNYIIDNNAEITFEMNPRTADSGMLRKLRDAGFNRVSMGVQSGIDSELAALGRRHTIADARRAAADVRAAGFDNLSLDLMLGIPEQTAESLECSLNEVCALEPEHISAYMLKIEPDTPFAQHDFGTSLADDDMQAELYEFAVRLLADKGYERYEISNFALPGRESRHNLHYWNCDEYLGFGPAAHSFFRGRRFCYPRNIDSFISCPETSDDGPGGDEEEYVMLRLRLSEGITQTGWHEKFDSDIPEIYHRRALALTTAGLLIDDEQGIRLNGRGFLLSNAVICRLLGE